MGTCHRRNKTAGRYRRAFVSSGPKDVETRSKGRTGKMPRSAQPERLLPVRLRGPWVQGAARNRCESRLFRGLYAFTQGVCLNADRYIGFILLTNKCVNGVR